jgi:hypothetical protein
LAPTWSVYRIANPSERTRTLSTTIDSKWADLVVLDFSSFGKILEGSGLVGFRWFFGFRLTFSCSNGSYFLFSFTFSVSVFVSLLHFVFLFSFFNLQILKKLNSFYFWIFSKFWRFLNLNIFKFRTFLKFLNLIFFQNLNIFQI